MTEPLSTEPIALTVEARAHGWRLDHYLARLAHHGIHLDRDEAWRQYQICIVFCLTYSVVNWPQYPNMNERGQSLLRDMLQRAIKCVLDNNALDAIR